MLQIPVHTTILGHRNGKIVVACRDFRKPGDYLIEFRELKNRYIDELDYDLNPSLSEGNGNRLCDILTILNHHPDLISLHAKDRFWDMFIVDFLIANND